MLVPCERCRRHVRDEESRCPFCATPRTPTPRTPRTVLGRLSRAAVFAGFASCGGATSHTEVRQPPGPDLSQVTVAHDATTGGIVGTVVDHHGRPVTGFTVALDPPLGVTGAPRLTTASDARGVFTFERVPPGTYVLTYQTRFGGRFDQPERVSIEVHADQVTRHAVQFEPPPPPDRGPCCKPYGAPPARGRVV